MENCDIEGDKCSEECLSMENKMAKKSGFKIQNGMFVPYGNPSQYDFDSMKYQAKIIKKFKNACEDKCDYTWKSCAARCDGEAIASMHNIPSTPVSPLPWNQSYPSHQDDSHSSPLDEYIKNCQLNCRALKQRLFFFKKKLIF